MQSPTDFELGLENAIKSNNFKQTSLIIAIIKRDDPASSLLSLDSDNKSFLTQAAALNRLEIAQLLLNEHFNNKDFDHLFKRDTQGRTFLSYAAENGGIDLIKILIEQIQKMDDPEKFTLLWVQADNNGFTPLHYAAKHKQIHAAELILQQLAKKDHDFAVNAINQVDRMGDTALHYACDSNSPKLIALLINHGADICIKNNKRLTPFNLIHEFSKKTQSNIVDLLHENEKIMFIEKLKQVLLGAEILEENPPQYDYQRLDRQRFPLSLLIDDLHQVIENLKARPNGPLLNKVFAVLAPLMGWGGYLFGEAKLISKFETLDEENDPAAPYYWAGGLLYSIVTPIVLTLSNIYFSRWMWNKGSMASQHEWKDLIDNLRSDVLANLMQIARFDSSRLPISAENLAALKSKLQKLDQDLPNGQAIQALIKIEATLTDLLMNMNRSNKPIQQLHQSRDILFASRSEEVAINSGSPKETVMVVIHNAR